MSRPNQTTITCEQCGLKQPFMTWDSLNVTLNPEKKEEFLNGALTRFACVQCGWSGDVVYPLLYHDMEKGLMLWLLPEGNAPSSEGMGLAKGMKGYRFRRVNTRNELIEKVLIFDAELDDRVIELLKFFLRERFTKPGTSLDGELLFSGITHDDSGVEAIGFEHVSDTGSYSAGVPLDTYQQLKTATQQMWETIPPPSSPWLHVGAEFAAQLAAGMRQQ